MLDSRIRPIIDPALTRLARLLSDRGVSANQVTGFGFALGMLVVPLILSGWFHAALAILMVNRLCDGIDGAIARIVGQTDLGGYLDIVLDFIFYSAVVFAFCLAQPEVAVYGAFLIFSFIGTGTSFLAFAVMAEKRGMETSQQGEKSFFYMAGITEGFETILVLGLMCLVPAQFWLLALAFGTLCWISTLGRVVSAIKVLR
jgi:phosphatidylglycerophosphate synthase